MVSYMVYKDGAQTSQRVSLLIIQVALHQLYTVTFAQCMRLQFSSLRLFSSIRSTSSSSLHPTNSNCVFCCNYVPMCCSRHFCIADLHNAECAGYHTCFASSGHSCGETVVTNVSYTSLLSTLWPIDHCSIACMLCAAHVTNSSANKL